MDLETLRARCEAARAVAEAARVPDEDCDGPGSEPVTVSGWYAMPTVSGRPAWVRYDWRNGCAVQGVATYDLAAEKRYSEAAFEFHEIVWFTERDARR